MTSEESPVVPPRSLLLWELRAVPELVGGLLPRLGRSRLPRGKGEPVLVLPGFAADDLAVWLLTQRVKRLGYEAESWGLGRNTGNLKRLMPMLVERVLKLAESSGQKVRLVGWSLGGTMSREVAREYPEAVAQLVTLGSPVVGGGKFTYVSRIYKKQGVDVERMAKNSDARETAKAITVPVTALYDRHDGIVNWSACIDRYNKHVKHVEVQCSHIGMVLDQKVFAEIARALAQV